MYILDTDASEFGLGAVLSQRQNGQERVIAYASRSMNRSELKYETIRKELLAVVYGFKQFRQYLLGRHFVIRTDHAALSWLRRTPEPMPQWARWLTLIEQYDYEVVHRSGNRHCNADGLSRRPQAAEPDIESPLSVNSIDRIDEKSSSEEVATSSVRESLIKQQRSDSESTRIVQMQLTHTEGCCRFCEQCATYYRRMLCRQGPLKPIMTEANSVNTEGQHDEGVIAEHQLSQQEEVRLDSGVA